MSKADKEHFRVLFQYAPVSMWEEDFGGIRHFFDGLHGLGVTDFASHFSEHPADIGACMQTIQVTDLNLQTMLMLGAATQTGPSITNTVKATRKCGSLQL